MDLELERRAGTRESEDALSPEILALLVTCGGRIRASDSTALADDEAAAAERRESDRRGDDRRRQERRTEPDTLGADPTRPSRPNP